jgi:hypothetical protein
LELEPKLQVAFVQQLELGQAPLVAESENLHQKSPVAELVDQPMPPDLVAVVVVADQLADQHLMLGPRLAANHRQVPCSQHVHLELRPFLHRLGCHRQTRNHRFATMNNSKGSTREQEEGHSWIESNNFFSFLPPAEPSNWSQSINRVGTETENLNILFDSNVTFFKSAYARAGQRACPAV